MRAEMGNSLGDGKIRDKNSFFFYNMEVDSDRREKKKEKTREE
jgi:hypothetical protein